jgi:NADH:ubiquinone oxidoreductase subunit F (NADH-binding)
VVVPTERTLSLTEPVASVRDYVRAGGGEGLAKAQRARPESVIDTIEAAGLRGRGGAGFPTAVKWRSIRAAGCPTTYVVCNAAEGEPGTFKDRWILRQNPYQVIEGIAIAAVVTGASRAFLVIKSAFEREIAVVQAALTEMREAGLLGTVPVSLVLGPDHYLLGEEKATVEVVEGGEPLPRVLPPYQVGLFARTGSLNPTTMNNVETLAHVTAILRRGSDWFRSCGTDESPGTTVFTLCGDVHRPGVAERPLGLSLRALIDDVGEGAAHGQVKAVIPGASGALLTAGQLDTPLDFDSMRAAGSGLGSGGFVVYDDSACIVAAVLVFAKFLAIESCAQCPACKLGTLSIAECLARIERGEGSAKDLDTLAAKCGTVTGGQRCALPTGAAQLVRSALEAFPAEIEAHLGHPCPLPRSMPTPKIVDFDETSRRFTYDDRYQHKQPDWTYSERPDEEWSA